VHRDLGLTRARTVTVGLAGVTVVGVVALAGLARHDTDTGTQAATSNSTDSSNSTGSTSDSTGSNSSSTSTDDGSSNTFPNLGGHTDSGGSGGGAATSGGS